MNQTPLHTSMPKVGEEPAGKASGSHQNAAGDFGRAKVGRKSLLLDAAKMQKLYDALLAGNFIRNACDIASIAEPTFYRWMHAAESAEQGSALREFRDAVKKAQAEAQHRSVMIIQQAARTNWTAAAWFLERTRPDEWGRKSRIALSGDGDGSPITAKVEVLAQRSLTDHELLQVMRDVVKREEEKAERRKLESKFATVAKAA